MNSKVFFVVKIVLMLGLMPYGTYTKYIRRWNNF